MICNGQPHAASSLCRFCLGPLSSDIIGHLARDKCVLSENERRLFVTAIAAAADEDGSPQDHFALQLYERHRDKYAQDLHGHVCNMFDSD